MKNEKTASVGELSSVTVLFDKAWELYKKVFITLMRVNILPVAILAYLSIITAFATAYYKSVIMVTDKFNTVEQFKFFALMLGFFCTSVLISSLVYVAQIKTIEKIDANNEEFRGKNRRTIYKQILEIYRSSAASVSSYIWIAVLATLSIFTGFILLIVPGIVVAVWFCFAPFVLILEHEKGKAALLKSKDYVRGLWTPIFTRIVAIIAFMFLIGFARAVFQIFLNTIFGAGLNDRFIVDIIFQSVISPFFIVYMYILYKDVVAVQQVDSLGVEDNVGMEIEAAVEELPEKGI